MRHDGGQRDDKRSLRLLWILSVDPSRLPDGQLNYSVGLINAAAASGADITVVHLGTSAARFTPRASVAWRPEGVANRHRLRSLFSRLPAMAYTAGAPRFRRDLVGELAQRRDAVVIDHVQSGWALSVIDRHLDPSTALVHVSHNDEQTVRRRVASGTATSRGTRLALHRDARKVAALEDRILRRADIVTTITPDDATALKPRRDGRTTVVLTPGYDGPRVARREITAATPRRAVIAGSMLWRVKQFDLLALLRIADARFAAAGAEIVVLGEAPKRFEAEVLRSTRATKMLGRVDSLAEAFSDARLALLSEPHGGGFKLKTLDYVFQRVPLFVQAGSTSGLPLDDGHGLREFATVEALVDGALDALDDLDALNALQNTAYTRCAPGFDWATRGARLVDAIARAKGPAATVGDAADAANAANVANVAIDLVAEEAAHTRRRARHR